MSLRVARVSKPVLLYMSILFFRADSRGAIVSSHATFGCGQSPRWDAVGAECSPGWSKACNSGWSTECSPGWSKACNSGWTKACNSGWTTECSPGWSAAEPLVCERIQHPAPQGAEERLRMALLRPSGAGLPIDDLSRGFAALHPWLSSLAPSGHSWAL